MKIYFIITWQDMKEKFHLNQTYVNIILVCEGREDIFYVPFYLIAIKVNEGIEQLKREKR